MCVQITLPKFENDDNLRGQVSISPTFNVKLLRAKAPKVQTDTDDLTVFLCIWDLC